MNLLKITKNVMTGILLICTSLFLFCNQTPSRKLDHFGLISGIIGKELKADWKGTLQQAAELGFTDFEGSVHDVSPQDFLDFCTSVGITPIAGGIKFSEDMNEVQKSMDRLKALNMKYAVTYWPWLTGEPFKLKDCQKSAALLNKIGTLAKENGLIFCWHNHHHEFKEMEEGIPFDYLMAHTDPELVNVELDVYWVKRGGYDPIQIMKKYAGRIALLHIKDMAPGDDMDFACPGSGIIDFPAIFSEADKQGIKHWFIERDKVPDGMACLKSASEYLKNLRY